MSKGGEEKSDGRSARNLKSEGRSISLGGFGSRRLQLFCGRAQGEGEVQERKRTLDCVIEVLSFRTGGDARSRGRELDQLAFVWHVEKNRTNFIPSSEEKGGGH